MENSVLRFNRTLVYVVVINSLVRFADKFCSKRNALDSERNENFSSLIPEGVLFFFHKPF